MLTSLGQAGQCATRPSPPAPVCARQRSAAAKTKAPGRAVAKAAKVEDAEVSHSITNGASTVNPLVFDELAEIIRMVHDTDIVELELKSKRFSLAVRKKEALESPEPATTAYQPQQQFAPPQYQQPQQYAPQPQAPPAPAPAPAPAASAPASASPAAASANGGSASAGGGGKEVEVLSPMSGTMYRSPAPGELPFVKEGDRVTKGQTVAIIEAMKLMNEIESETAGTVVKFLTENGTSVNPGQPLVLIRP
ncbi:hypothetical protein WJX81_002764 [Elliptochloris bilobata]|uniref:Biotin carboxyl carrier protein of acetyl-CoA carboxylase n=1 Tax=Elliptochloris bilobata TaxID=381761 RepID=A0AAW1SKZ1_9CHLO